MSDHAIRVFRIESIEPHPNADRLKIIRVDGFQSCVGGALLHAKPGDLAVFVPPQFVVNEESPLFEVKERTTLNIHPFRALHNSVCGTEFIAAALNKPGGFSDFRKGTVVVVE